MENKIFKNWTCYEVIWLCVFSSVAIILTIIWKDTLLGFSVFITGVLCVILAAKGSIWNYSYGIYNTIGYAYLAFNNGLYGEVGLNLLFFLPTSIIGIFMWRKHINGTKVKMLQMKNKSFTLIFIICMVNIVILGFLLSLIKGQNIPYIDATTDILSIAATLLMLKRYKEQWLLYISLNVFSVVMWTIRTIQGSQDGAMMIVMWSAFLINAVYGYYTWNKGAKEYDY